MTGVYPVFKNQFKIGDSDAAMNTIAEMENFSVSIDGNVEEWSPMEAEGWLKRMVTGKALTISLSGKRCVGDPGNDYVATKAWKTGADCEGHFEWTFPSGAKLSFPCVVSVTNPGSGESRNVAALEADIMSNGKPEFTPAAA